MWCRTGTGLFQCPVDSHIIGPRRVLRIGTGEENLTTTSDTLVLDTHTHTHTHSLSLSFTSSLVLTSLDGSVCVCRMRCQSQFECVWLRSFVCCLFIFGFDFLCMYSSHRVVARPRPCFGIGSTCPPTRGPTPMMPQVCKEETHLCV